MHRELKRRYSLTFDAFYNLILLTDRSHQKSSKKKYDARIELKKSKEFKYLS